MKDTMLLTRTGDANSACQNFITRGTNVVIAIGTWDMIEEELGKRKKLPHENAIKEHDNVRRACKHGHFLFYCASLSARLAMLQVAVSVLFFLLNELQVCAPCGATVSALLSSVPMTLGLFSNKGALN